MPSSSSLPYINQTAPFWDFIASLEEQGSQHPFFAQFNNNPPPPHPSSNRHPNPNNTNDHPAPNPFTPHHPFGPWGWSGMSFPFGSGEGGIPHRPRGGGGPHRHHHAHEHNEHGETEEEEEEGEKQFEKELEEELNKEFGGDDEKLDKEKENEEEGGNDNGEGPSTNSGSGSETEGFCRRRGGRGGLRGGRRDEHCGGGRRGGGRHGCGPRGWGWGGHGHGHGHGHGFGHGPHHHGHHPHGHGHGRRSGWGGGGRGGPFFFSGGGRTGEEGPQHPFNPLLAFLAPLFSPPTTNTTADTTSNDDFTPEADIFDTPTSYIIHISLPGAKKEDVGVNWDAEKSELSVAGVVYSPADEKLLEQLAMTERKVGAFERKVRLGTRANPANVDADGISAKLEDGVLRVEVRKMGDGGFVEVRRVDVE